MEHLWGLERGWWGLELLVLVPLGLELLVPVPLGLGR